MSRSRSEWKSPATSQPRADVPIFFDYRCPPDRDRLGIRGRRRLSSMELQLLDLRLARAGNRTRSGRAPKWVLPFPATATLVLINASPDLRSQLAAKPRCIRANARQPDRGRGAHRRRIDQTAGLLSLRERQPFSLIATAETLQRSRKTRCFVRAPEVVHAEPIAPGKRFQLRGGMEAEMFAVPGKPPLYLEASRNASDSAANVGIEVLAGRRGLRLSQAPRRWGPARGAARGRGSSALRWHAVHR